MVTRLIDARYHICVDISSQSVNPSMRRWLPMTGGAHAVVIQRFIHFHHMHWAGFSFMWHVDREDGLTYISVSYVKCPLQIQVHCIINFRHLVGTSDWIHDKFVFFIHSAANHCDMDTRPYNGQEHRSNICQATYGWQRFNIWTATPQHNGQQGSKIWRRYRQNSRFHYQGTWSRCKQTDWTGSVKHLTTRPLSISTYQPWGEEHHNRTYINNRWEHMLESRAVTVSISRLQITLLSPATTGIGDQRALNISGRPIRNEQNISLFVRCWRQ